MFPRIKEVKPLENYKLFIIFDSGESRLYDVKNDIDVIPDFKDLETIPLLFNHVQVDTSRTCVYWNDRIDIPSDTLLEYSVDVNTLN